MQLQFAHDPIAMDALRFRRARGIRATENNNYPTLLVFLLSFCVTAIVAYINMRQLPRLESEQKSGAIFG